MLPFSNVGSDADTEFFADGLTDELIGLLGRVRSVRVISRTSAMRLKGVDRPLGELAREVRVRYALEGSVRRRGNDLRITSRLVDTRDEMTLWSDRFAGTLDDVFALQEELASRITRSLEVVLTPQEQRRISRRPTISTATYDYYLRAKQESLAFSETSTRGALALLDRALALNGPDELLYGAKGIITVWALDLGVFTDPAVLDEADRFGDQALALDPDSVLGLVAKGGVATKRGETIVAARYLRRALALDPGNADATNWLCLVYASSGIIERAAALADRAVDLDPLTPMVHCFPGFVAWIDGRPRDAIAPYDDWYRMDPRSAYARVCLASVLLSARENERAMALLEETAADPTAGVWRQAAEFFAAAFRRDRDRMSRALTAETIAFAKSQPDFASWFAWGHALGGDYDEAVQWIAAALERGFLVDRWVEGSIPDSRPLREHPAYPALQAEMIGRQAAFIAAVDADLA